MAAASAATASTVNAVPFGAAHGLRAVAAQARRAGAGPPWGAGAKVARILRMSRAVMA
jgi:hypothetical protein